MIRRRTKEGYYAWIVASAAGGAVFLLSGSIGTYGVIFVELMDMFKASKTRASLIGSIQIGLSVTGLSIGYLVKKLGLQPIGYMATALVVTGYILSMFTHSLWVLYITLGILQGLGYAILRTIVAIPLHLYFDERKSKAFAILTTSFSTGLLVWPILTWWLIQECTLRGTFFILAAIHLHGFIFFKLMNEPETPAEEISKTKSDQLSELPQKHSKARLADLKIDQRACAISNTSRGTTQQGSYISEDCEFSLKDSGTTREINSKNPKASYDIEPNHLKIGTKTSPDVSIEPSNDPTDALKPPKESLPRLFGLHMCTNPCYILWMFGISLSTAGSDVVPAYIGPRAVLSGSSEQMAATIVTIYGIVGIVSRPFIGLLGDKFRRTTNYQFASALMLQGLLSIVSMVSNNHIFLVVFVSLNSVIAGVVKNFLLISPVDLWKQESSAMIVGHATFWSGVGYISGFALIGVLLDNLEDPGQMFAIVGGMEVVGGMMSLTAAWIQMRRTQRINGQK